MPEAYVDCFLIEVCLPDGSPTFRNVAKVNGKTGSSRTQLDALDVVLREVKKNNPMASLTHLRAQAVHQLPYACIDIL